MNKLLAFPGAILASALSLPAAAQVAPALPYAVIDTAGLRSRPLLPAVELIREDGFTNPVSYRGFPAGSVGRMICEVVPSYKKRSKKDSLLLFVNQHLQWPDKTGRMCIDGRVFVSFVVGANGQVYDAKVLKELHPLFDAEALRVVQLLNGHFTPALCGGVTRAHEYFLSIPFSLK